MKKAILLLAAILILPMYTFAQNGGGLESAAAHDWELESALPADSSVSGLHGLAFGGNGTVWGGPYFSIMPADERINPVYCVDPATKELCEDLPYIIGTVTADTLLRFGPITGMATDADGNILISSHGYRVGPDGATWNSSRAFVHRIDPATGEGLGVGEITVMRTETASQAFHIATDKYGDIFYSTVFPGEPIRMMDSNFDFILNVSENRAGFARTITAFTDDNDVTRVYQPTNFVTELVEGEDTVAVGGRVEVHEGDFITGFVALDTLSIIGMDPGAAATYPGNGVLFVPASGSGNNPEGDPERWDALTIYGIDVRGAGDINVVDQLAWDMGDGDPFNPIYRAMAISPDGLNLIVGGFSNAAHIQWFKRDSVLEIETSAGERLAELPEGYNLGQNYPNPFNPTTQISFEIGQAGLTSLKVYDLLGREVATLVNSDLPAGSHTIDFDAANLASGTYMYRLEANGYVLTRKMMLVK